MLIVYLAMAAGALVMVTMLRNQLLDSLQQRIIAQSNQVIRQVTVNQPDSATRDAAALNSSGLTQAQVLDGDGRILAESTLLHGFLPLSSTRPKPGSTVRLITDWTGPDGTQRLLVVARGVAAPGGYVVVLAGTTLAPVDRAVGTVQQLLLIGLPVLALTTGLIIYLSTGRALRPVEEIRAQVAALSERDLSARVPVPATHDEIEALARTTNLMLARLESAHTAQRRFVADASHELRSPLATLVASLELAGRQNNLDRTTYQTMQDETARMVRLVDDLLLLARADEVRVQLSREEVDLDEIVDAEGARWAHVSSLRLRVDAEHVRVSGDYAHLARVVRNLVENAMRYADKLVELRLRRDGPRAVIQVSDDGAGVPMADRQRIFERFVRLDPGRSRVDGGSGLGLAIVKELVDAHGGTVEVSDSALGGALFTVRLPADQRLNQVDQAAIPD